MPTIRDVLKTKGAEVVAVPPDHTIARAIGELVGRRIGSLLVTDSEGNIVGIITERDILRVVHDAADRIDSATVSEFMTTNVVCGVPDDDLDYVMSVMTEKRFRRMPVVKNGQLAGVISIGDVVKALKSAKEYEVRQLRDYISGAYA
jgi:CBS domain-containing protein